MVRKETINKILFFVGMLLLIKLAIHECKKEGQSNDICSKYTSDGGKVEDCGDLEDLGNISDCIKCF
tara:strand:- start:9 stop:209 length:201 start_codon:yes stop_codon:yes gene_type:complete